VFRVAIRPPSFVGSWRDLLAFLRPAVLLLSPLSTVVAFSFIPRCGARLVSSSGPAFHFRQEVYLRDSQDFASPKLILSEAKAINDVVLVLMFT